MQFSFYIDSMQLLCLFILSNNLIQFCTAHNCFQLTSLVDEFQHFYFLCFFTQRLFAPNYQNLFLVNFVKNEKQASLNTLVIQSTFTVTLKKPNLILYYILGEESFIQSRYSHIINITIFITHLQSYIYIQLQ